LEAPIEEPKVEAKVEEPAAVVDVKKDELSVQQPAAQEPPK